MNQTGLTVINRTSHNEGSYWERLHIKKKLTNLKLHRASE